MKNPDSDLDWNMPRRLHRNRWGAEQVPIFLVFATGFRSGLAKIEARLRELTGNPNVNGLIIGPADLSCFRSAARVFSEPAEADRARSAFREAGRVGIHDMAVERNWPPEKRIIGSWGTATLAD